MLKVLGSLTFAAQQSDFHAEMTKVSEVGRAKHEDASNVPAQYKLESHALSVPPRMAQSSRTSPLETLVYSVLPGLSKLPDRLRQERVEELVEYCDEILSR